MTMAGKHAPELDLDQVERVDRGGDEEDLHDRVVERVVGCRHEIDIAADEDDHVEQLRLERDSWQMGSEAADQRLGLARRGAVVEARS
jgi:hypothetical protein